MIIYKSKYFDDNKGNDDEISSKDRLKVAGAGLGAGVTALGIVSQEMNLINLLEKQP